MQYPAKFTRIPGGYLLTFRDFPAMQCEMRPDKGKPEELIKDLTPEEKIDLAQPVLAMCIKEYMRRSLNIPVSSEPLDDEILIPLNPVADPKNLAWEIN